MGFHFDRTCWVCQWCFLIQTDEVKKYAWWWKSIWISVDILPSELKQPYSHSSSVEKAAWSYKTHFSISCVWQAVDRSKNGFSRPFISVLKTQKITKWDWRLFQLKSWKQNSNPMAESMLDPVPDGQRTHRIFYSLGCYGRRWLAQNKQVKIIRFEEEQGIPSFRSAVIDY